MNIILTCILGFLVFLAIPASVYYLFVLKSNRDAQGHNSPTNVRRGRYENRAHIWSVVSAPHTYYPQIALSAPPSAVLRVSRSFSSRSASTHDDTELLLQEYQAAAYPPSRSPV